MTSNYPPSINIGRWSGVLLGVLAGVLPFFVWRVSLGPLGRFYLRTYVQASVDTLRPSWKKKTPVKTFPVITLSQSLGQDLHCAKNAILASAATLDQAPGKLGICLATIDEQTWYGWLRKEIFGGRSLPLLVRTPLVFWACLAVSLWVLGCSYDVRRRRQLVLQGDRVRGPELKTVRAYNRKMVFGRDGIKIVLASGHKKVDF